MYEDGKVYLFHTQIFYTQENHIVKPNTLRICVYQGNVIIKIEMCAGTHVEVKLQRISGKTNRNGQVEKRIVTDKWKNESQRTSGKTNRYQILTSSLTGRLLMYLSNLQTCP